MDTQRCQPGGLCSGEVAIEQATTALAEVLHALPAELGQEPQWFTVESSTTFVVNKAKRI